MREITAGVALLMTAIFPLVGPVQAQSAVDKYDLAERCGRRTEADFAKEWPDGIVNTSTGYMTASYTNHYNFRLNKCLYLLEVLIYDRGKAPLMMLTLFDINDNKGMAAFSKRELGQTSPSQCSVQEKFCRTEEEWRELIRPFMED
jgi:hypothetical protein